jgi:hypothetical protein
VGAITDRPGGFIVLYKFLYAFVMLFNRDYIPRLPRGMLAIKYNQFTDQERRVAARMGARDPIGVKVALRRAGVDSADDLVKQLDHYTPEREVRRRLSVGIGRVMGGHDHDPHAADILAGSSGRRNKKAEEAKKIADRVKATAKAFKDNAR